MEREKDNSLFNYSSKSKKFVEYSTPIKSSLISGMVYDDKYQYKSYKKQKIILRMDCLKWAVHFLKSRIMEAMGL